MPLKRWAGALLQRGALFILAGFVAVFLLHVQTGIVRPAARNQTATFSVNKWVDASAHYLRQLADGDLGVVRALRVQGYHQDQPVAKLLAEQGPRTLYLVATALVMSLLLGTLLGFLASRFSRTGWRGPALGLTLGLLSTPEILLIFLLRKLVVWTIGTFDITLFKVGSFANMAPADVIGPALALSALPIALVARIAAVAFDEVHSEHFVRTAVSKGLHPLRVFGKHVLKNAWIRVAEAGPVIVGGLVTGVVVVEYAFYFPGIGRSLGLMLERGGQPVATTSIVLCILVMAVLIDMLFNAMRLWLDPRLESEQASATSGGKFSVRDLRAVLSWPRELLGWLAEVPYNLSRAIWTWRPGRLLRIIWQNKPLLIGLTGIAGLVFVALFGSLLADLRVVQNAPRYINYKDEVFFPPYQPGLPGYPLGSDMAGRDLLSRLLVGARYTLFFTLAVTPVRFLIALPWGLIAGYRGGVWSGASRSLSLMVMALPVVLVPAALLPLRALAGANVGSGPSFWLITGALAVVGVPRLVENIRLQVQAALVQPFVEGARAAGANGGRILRRHVLPHLMPQLWVAAAADMAWTLLLLAQLGVFTILLGGSVQVAAGFDPMASRSPTMPVPVLPDWSSMLAKPYDVIYRAPWALWIPALAFMAAITAFNLTAEGLRRIAQQRLAAPASPDAVEEADGVERIPAPARRRLVFEWVAGLTVFALFLGVTVKYGGRAEPVVAAPLSPLDQARKDMGLGLETVFGTGDNLDKARTVVQLPNLVSRYLTLAHREKLTLAQIQQDSKGRLNLFELGASHRLFQVQVPDAANGSLMWLQDMRNGGIRTFQTSERPVYVTITPEEVIILAGTVPGPDNWVITIHRPFGQRDGDLASNLFNHIPADYNAKLMTRFRNQVTGIEMTGGPLNTARVSPDGTVEVCKTTRGPCVAFQWNGSGFTPKK